MGEGGLYTWEITPAAFPMVRSIPRGSLPYSSAAWDLTSRKESNYPEK